MTRTLRVGVCSLVALVALARPASADWHVTPFLGWTLGGSTTFPDPENIQADRTFGRGHFVLGASVTRFWRGPLGLEGIIAYVPGLFDRDEFITITSSRSVAAMGNVVVTIPRAWSEHGLRPFASGGFGLMHVAQTYPLELLSFDRNVLGYNVGGGAVGPLTDRAGIRFEVRRFSYVESGDIVGVSVDRENLSYWTATVGVVLRY